MWNIKVLKSSKTIDWLMAILLLCSFMPLQGVCAIINTQVADVTTKSFSVAWLADRAALGASLHVYRDQSGAIEELNVVQRYVGSSGGDSLIDGIAAISVTGLDPDTTYFYRLDVNFLSGLESFPQVTPLPSVKTQVGREFSDMFGQPIVNDILIGRFNYSPESTPGAGSILLIEIPSVSNYPLSAIAVYKGGEISLAQINLNNLFNKTGVNSFLYGEGGVKVREWRGYQQCGDGQLQQRTYYKKLNDNRLLASLHETDALTGCSMLDLDCSGFVDVADVNVLNAHEGAEVGGCGFYAPYDLVPDGVIDAADKQLILNAIE
ncbi:hypothetical protein [Marinagarivorans cellulosilyticus]|uniref:hypothetical protein n=1 Tax=Marinagarivorans cellulosilyticus TaxID=2721545 RepID=UPI001F26EB03|nr:hypothetical protein [Marinagarivorans cellulosilyticus]